MLKVMYSNVNSTTREHCSVAFTERWYNEIEFHAQTAHSWDHFLPHK